MKPLVPTLALALATSAAALPAGAIELYATAPGGTVLVPSPLVYAPPPAPVVLVRPARPLVLTRPLVLAGPTHTTVTVTTPAAPSSSSDDGDEATHPQSAERRDPTASFFIGGGYGGMTALRGGAASSYRLHVGLGLGATELGLRADIANRALGELSNSSGGLWLLSAEVAHRFLPGATVRPVLGASFDRWQVEPDGRESASAFGLGARAGIEIHYHINPGAALVFGADLGFHRMLASVDNAAVVPNVLTFGATADIRL